MECHPVTLDRLPDLERLFASERGAQSCWCTWFIIRVKDYHANGEAGNAATFREIAAASAGPMGVLAFREGEPVGWAAAGPRSRYARAVQTPTLKGIDHAENDDVWLVPCFFIRPDMRRRGIARRLLEGAVEMARGAKASAIEGFPTAGVKLGSADRQVGTEHLFESCGFRSIRRPSSNRVVMRLDLVG